MRSVLSRLFPPPGTPSAWPTPIGTKSPSTASAAPSTPSRTSGIRDHSTVRPSPGVPSRRSRSRPCARRWSSRALIVAPGSVRSGRGGQSSGAGTSARHPLELGGPIERALAEGGVDGEDLAVGDVAHGAGLGHLVPFDGEDDIDVDDLAGAGVGEVLGRRPDRRAPRRALHGGDRRPEAGTPEQEVTAGGRCPCVTGSFQRNRLWVGSKPRNVRVSIGADGRGPSPLGSVPASRRCGDYVPSVWGTHPGPETPARSSTPSGEVSARRSRSWRRCSRRSTPAR